MTEIRFKISQKGSLKELSSFFSDKEMVKKVIGKEEDYTSLLAEEMKKVIKDGNVLRTLRDSTEQVRRLRGHNVTKPLFASGALYDSIKATKNGVSFLDYGAEQIRGFTPKYVPGRNIEEKLSFKLNKNGIPVEGRNFTVSVNNKRVAEQIRKKVSKNLPKVIAKNMRVGIKVKAGS